MGTAIGALAVPALFFVLLESGLIIGRYGFHTDLVRELHGPPPTCYLNPDVAHRYFSPALRSIQPSIGFRTFDRHKTPGSLRVFVLGESTTAGFPFHVNGSFAGFLEDELRATYPDRDIEVINCGMSAISSYVVLDFARQLVRYEPDLFVVYTGHNEFYGALGAASARAANASRSMTLLEMKLAGLRTYQLVSHLIFRLGGDPANGHAGGRSLMAAMIGDRTIRLDDPLHRQAEDAFRANLTDIIRVAREHHVPVILSTMASNLRDLPPFGSASTNPSDTTNATASYERARALDTGGTAQAPNAARSEYIRARDHDVVHFRACGRFNDIIRDVATAHGVPLVDMDAVFAAQSPGRTPGLNLFLEHLHPNLHGAMLMADALLDAMQECGIVPPAARTQRSFDEALGEACITPLDLELARQRIVLMTGQWPFVRAFGNGPEFKEAPPAVARMARGVLERKIDLAAAHEELGRQYLSARDMPRALDEFRAVAKIYPVSPSGPIHTADILMELKRPAEAIPWYVKGLALDPQSVETRFHLALAYDAVGAARNAREECRRLLATDPHHAAARRLFDRLSERGRVVRGNQG